MTKSSNPPIQKICPLVQAPLSSCHCVNLTSSSAEAAIFFCGEHYEKCEIYKRHKNGKIACQPLESVAPENRERSKP